MYYTYYSTELYHHGVKGMKWGIRRYQKKDGSLTSRGMKRYSSNSGKSRKKMSTAKKIAIGAAVVAGLAVVGYATYKISKEHHDLYILRGKMAAEEAKKTGDFYERLVRLAKKSEQASKIYSGTPEADEWNKLYNLYRNDAANAFKKEVDLNVESYNWNRKAAKTLYGRIKR